MTSQASPSWRRVWRRIPTGIWGLGLVSMFMDMSSEMIHALLPLYLVGVLGASATMVGLIEGVAEATASITKVFSGAISDWLGKRKVLALAGYGLAALTKPVFPLAESVSVLFAARFVDRIGKGIRGAPRDALVADLTPPNLRGASYGLRQSLDTLGAFLGPAIAIVLMWWTADNFRAVFWVAVLPAVICVLVLIFLVREPERPVGERKVKAPLSRAELGRLGSAYWWVTGVAMIFTLARFSEAFLILRSQSVGLPLELAPLVLVVMNIVYMLAAFPAGILSDRINKLGVLVAGLVVFIGADIVLAWSGGIFGFGLGVALWGLHLGLTQGLLSSLVADTVPAELRGTGFGVFNMLSGVSLLAASVVAGGFWDVIGPQATFLASAGITAVAIVGLVGVKLAFPALGAVHPQSDASQ